MTPAWWTRSPPPHRRKTEVTAVSRREVGFAVQELTFWGVKEGLEMPPIPKARRKPPALPLSSLFPGSRELVGMIDDDDDDNENHHSYREPRKLRATQQ